MENLHHEISFQIPTNFNFETFTAFPPLLSALSSSSPSSSSSSSAGVIVSSIGKAINESNNNFSIKNSDDMKATIIDGSGRAEFIQKISEKIGRGLSNSEVNMIRNQIVLNNSNFGADEWQKQLEYDRIMNEIWIGVVLTLIVISIVFCICSCFLYHQFRHWKRNYRRNIGDHIDIESMKLNPEDDDPVPNYTLVSGLPSYEAAIEQLRKSSSSSTSSGSFGLSPYPSVFNIFNNQNEKLLSHQMQSTNSESVLGKSMREFIVIPSYEEATTTTTIEHSTICDSKHKLMENNN